MLAELLRRCKPALSADLLRVYGLRLREVLAGLTTIGVLELADWAAELPRGSQVWRHIGGSQAVTDESEMSMLVELRLRQLAFQAGGNKGDEPKLLDYPESREQREQDLQKVTTRAERWKARHGG